MTRSVHDRVCLPVDRLCNKLCKKMLRCTSERDKIISRCNATHKASRSCTNLQYNEIHFYLVTSD